mmetsp:Transcript_29373/g.46098  ORF Transcript_29373/g.46098 Transcript_29373/m.46098 type:complete len:199 (+) Transcript_29373:2-598(+)
MHDAGDGWVLMNGEMGQPLAFASEESSWWGQLLAGRSRQATYFLLDLQRRPIVKMDKPYAMFMQKGSVTLVNPEEGSEGALGAIEQEFEMIKRRVLVTDATPNHAAGTVVIESTGLANGIFNITLGSTVLGTISQPRYGLGVATLSLTPGGLDPFRSNRMRVLLIFGCFLVCDTYWGLSPGPATVAKAGMAGVGRVLL